MTYSGGVPRSPEQEHRLLAERPEGWEYMLYASALLRGMEEHEAMFRDNEIGFAPRSAESFDADNVMSFISQRMAEFSAAVSGVERVLSDAAQAAAFGEPGQPGDVDRIRHIAHRLVSIYNEVLVCAARIRGATVPSQFEEVVGLAAAMGDQPIRQMRTFILDLVRDIDSIPGRLALDEPVIITASLVVTIDDELIDNWGQAMRRLERELGL